MAQAFKCDRCGLLFSESVEKSSFRNYEIYLEYDITGTKVKCDLCDSCRKAFNDYMNSFLSKDKGAKQND